eukprot:gb/GECH01007370.1/.p1 GENE.gb/GECH01007370.1/~~gb/GECH01007370.1/.p1  ORF type:complete len:1085 (+),score=157.98 gb/GECH01007370.1/:1-3255(+)
MHIFFFDNNIIKTNLSMSGTSSSQSNESSILPETYSKIKKVEIGFKNDGGSMTINFDDKGAPIIVGPNGVGKSFLFKCIEQFVLIVCGKSYRRTIFYKYTEKAEMVLDITKEDITKSDKLKTLNILFDNNKETPDNKLEANFYNEKNNMSPESGEQLRKYKRLMCNNNNSIKLNGCSPSTARCILLKNIRFVRRQRSSSTHVDYPVFTAIEQVYRELAFNPPETLWVDGILKKQETFIQNLEGDFHDLFGICLNVKLSYYALMKDDLKEDQATKRPRKTDIHDKSRLTGVKEDHITEWGGNTLHKNCFKFRKQKDFEENEADSFDDLSGGEQDTLISLASLRLGEAVNIFMDEPGVFLHQSARHRFKNKLLDIAKEKNIAFITHMPDMFHPRDYLYTFRMSKVKGSEKEKRKLIPIKEFSQTKYKINPVSSDNGVKFEINNIDGHKSTPFTDRFSYWQLCFARTRNGFLELFLKDMTSTENVETLNDDEIVMNLFGLDPDNLKPFVVLKNEEVQRKVSETGGPVFLKIHQKYLYISNIPSLCRQKGKVEIHENKYNILDAENKNQLGFLETCFHKSLYHVKQKDGYILIYGNLSEKFPEDTGIAEYDIPDNGWWFDVQKFYSKEPFFVIKHHDIKKDDKNFIIGEISKPKKNKETVYPLKLQVASETNIDQNNKDIWRLFESEIAPILFETKIIFVEGETDKIFMDAVFALARCEPGLFKEIFPNSSPEELCNWKIINAGGFDKIPFLVERARKLEASVAVVADMDKWRERKRLEGFDVPDGSDAVMWSNHNVLFWPNEQENFFPDEQLKYLVGKENQERNVLLQKLHDGGWTESSVNCIYNAVRKTLNSNEIPERNRLFSFLKSLENPGNLKKKEGEFIHKIEEISDIGDHISKDDLTEEYLSPKLKGLLIKKSDKKTPISQQHDKSEISGIIHCQKDRICRFFWPKNNQRDLWNYMSFCFGSQRFYHQESAFWDYELDLASQPIFKKNKHKEKEENNDSKDKKQDNRFHQHWFRGLEPLLILDDSIANLIDNAVEKLKHPDTRLSQNSKNKISRAISDLQQLISEDNDTKNDQDLSEESRGN